MKKNTGRIAENYTQAYLLRHGLTIIQQNYYSPYGEIDMIGLQNNTLVFIEVRYRQNSAFGGAIGSITTQKQQRIIHTAAYFLNAHRKYKNYDCRFDVVCLQGDLAHPEVNWIKAAFIIG